ncbi:MAG: phenylalanine 4-monooxygenase [Kangiellaceae bacterium]|jgi:phenylalanine-4-hydroxylase|nr:phenylalanine 4-monooxygenase [Kangiellaceae bacterium]
MSKSTEYTAKLVDNKGLADYSDEENATWSTLFHRQIETIKGRACEQYINGLEQLKLCADNVPQLPDVNSVLNETTGWQVEPVPALIPFQRFFELLAARRFPAATFIRRPADLDYLQEPDIFHEIFGHCPLLTHPVFAEFSYEYGKLGLTANRQQRKWLARLYWFTVEFGLINTEQGQRIYGAGILSSHGETIYALDNSLPQVERRQFDLETVLRTPYRIDIMQPIYYVIDTFEQLFNVMDGNLLDSIDQAIKHGDYAASFPAKAKAS